MSLRPLSDEVTPQRLLGALDVAIENAEHVKPEDGARMRRLFLNWYRRSHEGLRKVTGPTAVNNLLPLEIAARVSGMAPEPGNADSSYGLIEAELDLAVARLQAARDAFAAELDDVGRRAGRFIVLDTSVPITHMHKLQDMVVADDIEARKEPIRLVFPMAVIDELDRLKEQRDGETPWRASYALGVLYELLRDGRGPALLRESTFPPEGGNLPRGEVTVEVLHDPPLHVRLPITDDEIVQRALDLKGLARGRDVTLLTFDTSMAFRARANGLDVVRLDRAKHLAARWVAAMNELQDRRQGEAAREIRAALKREWSRFGGGSATDSELTKVAQQISEGTRVEFKYDPKR